MSELNHREIIKLLGIDRVCEITGRKRPTVYEWMRFGIPDHFLKDLAPTVERLSDGRFSRQTQWPTTWHLYWPELAEQSAPSPLPQAPAHEHQAA